MQAIPRSGVPPSSSHLRKALRFPLFSCFLVTTTCATRADVACPAIFSDHMVLQREKPALVWGTAAPGERVVVEFAGQSVETTTNDAGAWKLELAPMPASREPRALTIRGNNTLAFTDVLVGEVWLCSGQSNMEKPLGPRRGQQPTDNFEEEIAAANHPDLRLFQMPWHGRPREGEDGLRWLPCSPETIRATRFSAAAYFFGRRILRELDAPVGLMHSSFGGTRIEAWTPAPAFERDPLLRDLLNTRYFAWVEGVQPTELFQSMIAPLAPFTLRGFLWYQGESNCMAGDGAIYTAKMRALVAGWREAWNDETLPVFFALLAPFNYSEQPDFPEPLTPQALPLFREAQSAACNQIPNTAMIVTTDLAGDARDIHPTNKRDVGLRFAGLALKRAHGRDELAAESPRFVSARPLAGGRIEIRFTHTNGGLATSDGAPPTEFTVAGAGRVFHPAQAVIAGDAVVVSSESVPHPQAARFNWHETARSNLINAAGLPVAPFRTDLWEVAAIRDQPPDETSPETEERAPNS